MDANRKKQRRTAFIIGGILLVLILLSIMLYQIIAIGQANARYDELCAKVEYYKQLKEEGAAEDEIRQTEEWIIQRARELGYRFENDKLYKE
ncbi:MAG: hypothetical protein SPL13_05335 [Clostridia bacterium]|nr:hypothetical protein [Clostridia bacterium]